MVESRKARLYKFVREQSKAKFVSKLLQKRNHVSVIFDSSTFIHSLHAHSIYSIRSSSIGARGITWPRSTCPTPAPTPQGTLGLLKHSGTRNFAFFKAQHFPRCSVTPGTIDASASTLNPFRPECSFRYSSTYYTYLLSKCSHPLPR